MSDSIQLTNRGILDGLACNRCGAESPAMIPDGVGERGQLFRCADGCSNLWDLGRIVQEIRDGTDTTNDEPGPTLAP